MTNQDRDEAIELLLTVSTVLMAAMLRAKIPLAPREKTTLQDALRDCQAVPDVTRRIASLLGETVLEREDKRETPPKR